MNVKNISNAEKSELEIMLREVIKKNETIGMLNMKNAVLVWMETNDISKYQMITLIKAMNDEMRRRE